MRVNLADLKAAPDYNIVVEEKFDTSSYPKRIYAWGVEWTGKVYSGGETQGWENDSSPNGEWKESEGGFFQLVMKLPTLTRQSLACQLWPELTRQAAVKRLDRVQMTNEDQRKALEIISAHIDELIKYGNWLKTQT